jgi:hypothetical protein
MSASAPPPFRNPRTEMTNQIRGVLKTFGVVLGKEKGMTFDAEVDRLARGGGMFNETLQALMAVLRILREQIARLADPWPAIRERYGTERLRLQRRVRQCCY